MGLYQLYIFQVCHINEVNVDSGRGGRHITFMVLGGVLFSFETFRRLRCPE